MPCFLCIRSLELTTHRHCCSKRRSEAPFAPQSGPTEPGAALASHFCNPAVEVCDRRHPPTFALTAPLTRAEKRGRVVGGKGGEGCAERQAHPGCPGRARTYENGYVHVGMQGTHAERPRLEGACRTLQSYCCLKPSACGCHPSKAGAGAAATP